MQNQLCCCFQYLFRIQTCVTEKSLRLKCQFSTYDRVFPWLDDLSGPGLPHYRGFTITLRYTTLGRNSLNEWSARCRDLWQHTRLKRSILWTSDRLAAETSDNIHFLRDRHPCSQQESKPQSHLASDSRITPSTARPLGSAHVWVGKHVIWLKLQDLPPYLRRLLNNWFIAWTRIF
jgi:hypothetical protein